jgi:hypothetical protein
MAFSRKWRGRLCVTGGKVRKKKKRQNELREVWQGNITLDRKGQDRTGQGEAAVAEGKKGQWEEKK